LWQEIGQLFDGASLIVQPTMGIAGRQRRRRMAGQFLQGAQVDAGAGAERQIGMPQGVEVGEERAVRSLDGVGDASGVQVDPQHLRSLPILCPRAAPDRLTIWLVAEIVPQQFGHVGGQRLHLQDAALVPPRRQGNGGDLRVQVETLWHQRRQGGGAEPRPASRGVQVETVPSAQAAKGPLTGAGGGQQGAQLVRRQLPPIVAAVHLGVARFQVSHRVVSPAAVLNQPAAEALEMRQVVIRRLDTAATGRQLAHGLHRGAGEATLRSLARHSQAMTPYRVAERRGSHAEQPGGLGARKRFHGRQRFHRRRVAAQAGQPIHDARGAQVRQKTETAAVE
jgi:hypothetical protein